MSEHCIKLLPTCAYCELLAGPFALSMRMMKTITRIKLMAIPEKANEKNK